MNRQIDVIIRIIVIGNRFQYAISSCSYVCTQSKTSGAVCRKISKFRRVYFSIRVFGVIGGFLIVLCY